MSVPPAARAFSNVPTSSRALNAQPEQRHSDDGLSAVSKALVAICRTMPYVQCASLRGVNRWRTLQQPVALQFFR